MHPQLLQSTSLTSSTTQNATSLAQEGGALPAQPIQLGVPSSEEPMRRTFAEVLAAGPEEAANLDSPGTEGDSEQKLEDVELADQSEDNLGAKPGEIGHQRDKLPKTVSTQSGQTSDTRIVNDEDSVSQTGARTENILINPDATDVVQQRDPSESLPKPKVSKFDPWQTAVLPKKTTTSVAIADGSKPIETPILQPVAAQATRAGAPKQLSLPPLETRPSLPAPQNPAISQQGLTSNGVSANPASVAASQTGSEGSGFPTPAKADAPTPVAQTLLNTRPPEKTARAGQGLVAGQVVMPTPSDASDEIDRNTRLHAHPSEALASRPQTTVAGPTTTGVVAPESPQRTTPRIGAKEKRESTVDLLPRAEKQTQPAVPKQRTATNAISEPMVTQWQSRPLQIIEKDTRTAREIAQFDPITGEPRLSPIGPTTSAAARAELPAHIARQLAEVVQQMPNRPVEITLKPQELGSVRLMVQQAETGIVVNVTAERPETLDLMRRHIDQLGQEFQTLGYTDIAFSFDGGEPEAHSDTDDDDPTVLGQSPAEVSEDVPAQITQINLNTGTGNGVDIRL